VSRIHFEYGFIETFLGIAEIFVGGAFRGEYDDFTAVGLQKETHVKTFFWGRLG
jgi:hypothetical protein